jgi:4'-phosphopantetheinyl transferase
VSCRSIIVLATRIGSSLRCELENTPTHVETQQEVRLWLADPGEVCSVGESVYTALLSPDELARAGAFRFEVDRQVYLTTRALVRVSLSHYHGGAAKLWRFKSNRFGKPETDPSCGLRFNVAHTRQLVACMVSRGIELGVDAEGKDRADEIVGLAEEVFSLTELEQLRALHEDERRDRALTLWTLKEAYVKALGKGMFFPLKRVSFVFGAGGQIRLDEDTELDGLGVPWQFCTMDHAAHRIAVVIERTPGIRLKPMQLRSPGEIPVALADGNERWFQSARG